MKILCLYHNVCALGLFEWLKEQGHDTYCRTQRLDARWCLEQKFDLTVSYTYRYILPVEILDALGNNVVNIHTSYLPWNRGADPNLWSILEETPRGVTLHYMNEELDGGAVIAQQLVPVKEEGGTLATTYNHLDRAARQLFQDAFVYYDFWKEMRKETKGAGSYHVLADAAPVKKLIDSYDTGLSELKQTYGVLRNRRKD